MLACLIGLFAPCECVYKSVWLQECYRYRTHSDDTEANYPIINRKTVWFLIPSLCCFWFWASILWISLLLRGSTHECFNFKWNEFLVAQGEGNEVMTNPWAGAPMWMQERFSLFGGVWAVSLLRVIWWCRQQSGDRPKSINCVVDDATVTHIHIIFYNDNTMASITTANIWRKTKICDSICVDTFSAIWCGAATGVAGNKYHTYSQNNFKHLQVICIHGLIHTSDTPIRTGKWMHFVQSACNALSDCWVHRLQIAHALDVLAQKIIHAM